VGAVEGTIRGLGQYELLEAYGAQRSEEMATIIRQWDGKEVRDRSLGDNALLWPLQQQIRLEATPGRCQFSGVSPTEPRRREVA
jgi:hypothetical protein